MGCRRMGISEHAPKYQQLLLEQTEQRRLSSVHGAEHGIPDSGDASVIVRADKRTCGFSQVAPEFSETCM